MDNHILQEAARTYNTPCYIFDLDAFISRIRRMEQLLGKQVNIYYAMKANPFLTAAAARAAGGEGHDDKGHQGNDDDGRDHEQDPLHGKFQHGQDSFRCSSKNSCISAMVL